MDAIPRQPQRLDQYSSSQAVMPDHLERDAAACVGQRDAVVRLVFDQAELAEALDHPRSRTRRDPHPLSQRVGGDGRCAALLERVDRLGVILD